MAARHPNAAACAALRRAIRSSFVALVAAAALIGADPATAQTNPARMDSTTTSADRGSSVDAPADLSEPCRQARTRALTILAELDATLSAKVRAQVAQYVAKRAPSITITKAWSDFAMAAFLMGDSRLAAWAGLTAMRDDWQSVYVTNAGTYLVRLNRLSEALQLLNCAYSLGYRSPYLMEALAVAHQRLGDKLKANEAIQQARQLAPRDPIIDIEASLLGTGKPPARPESGKPLDGMDRALRELEAHAYRLSSKVKSFGEQLERLFPSQGGGPQAKLITTYFANLLDVARKQAAGAKNLSRDQYMQRFQQPGTPFSADGYQQALNHLHDTALLHMISSYMEMLRSFLSFPAGTSGTPVFLWADALGLDPRALAAERPNDAILWSMHGLGPALAQKVSDDYSRAYDVAHRNHTIEVNDCSRPPDEPCRIRADARFCVVRERLFQRWEIGSLQRFDLAARNFDNVARRLVKSAEFELADARAYADRTLKLRRLTATAASGSRSAGAQTTMGDYALVGVNQSYSGVIDQHLKPGRSLGLVTYLGESARWFTAERESMERSLAQQAAEIALACKPVQQQLAELLAQEHSQAYRDMLLDRMKGDIQFKTEDDFPCEANIGPIEVGIDLSKLGTGEGSVTGQWEVIDDLSVEFNKDVGPGKGYGGTIGGGANFGPFAGEAEVSLTSRENPTTGRKEGGIVIKGFAGFGITGPKNKKTDKKSRFGAVCYPSSGSVTFYPRAFVQDAINYVGAGTSRP